MMCDKDVCERWCVTKLMCDRWCVTKMCVKDEAAEAEADGTDTESKHEPHTKMGKTFLRSRKIVFFTVLGLAPAIPTTQAKPQPLAASPERVRRQNSQKARALGLSG